MGVHYKWLNPTLIPNYNRNLEFLLQKYPVKKWKDKLEKKYNWLRHELLQVYLLLLLENLYTLKHGGERFIVEGKYPGKKQCIKLIKTFYLVILWIFLQIKALLYLTTVAEMHRITVYQKSFGIIQIFVCSYFCSWMECTFNGCPWKRFCSHFKRKKCMFLLKIKMYLLVELDLFFSYGIDI